MAVGIDFDPARFEGSTVTVASARGEHLPFPDASFDAVFACAVLQHVPDPDAIVREMRRVARPGAVVALADADWDGFLVHPADPLLDRGQDVLRALRRPATPPSASGSVTCSPTNGFERAEATAKTSSDGGAGTEAAGGFRAAAFEAPAAVALAESLGVSTADEMAEIAAAWRRWGASPGAFFAGFWVEALGWVPDSGSRRRFAPASACASGAHSGSSAAAPGRRHRYRPVLPSSSRLAATAWMSRSRRMM